MSKHQAATHPSPTGLVLAGGLSSRMGRDKAGLRLSDGQTLLERAVDLLRQAGCGVVLVSGEHRQFDGIADVYPRLGPLGGIASVLEARPALSGPLLVVPVDMPALDARDLQRLLEQARDGGHACFERSPLPLVLTLDEQVRRIVSEQIEGGELAVHALASRLNCSRIGIDDAGRLGNVNTPADWRRLAGEEVER
jgi:molybdenum cofactor guanylyltransferase